MSFPPPNGWPVPLPPGPAPLDQPQYDATIGQAASRFWRKFATFSGRASRSEYWWWALISTVISIVLQVIGNVAFGVLGGGFFPSSTRQVFDLRAILLPLIPALIWVVVAIVPSLALVIRRLHDTNRSGWWYLLSLPSLVGLPFELVGLASIDPERIVSSDFSGVAVVPLVVGAVLTLLGSIGGIVMLVFLISAPNPLGARFDRPPQLARTT